MIFIYTSSAAALGLDNKNTWAKILPPNLYALEVQPGDQAYLDISGLSPAALKKNLTLLKKGAAFWGIIDPKGSCDDPALYFFEGANDYIGQAVVKKGLSKKRFALALSGARPEKRQGAKGNVADDADSAGTKRKSKKLPAGEFEGWKSIRTGTEGTFFFLYVSLSGKSSLRSMLGETSFNYVKNRLREILQQALQEADALLWMETENNSLFLVPPRQRNGNAAVEASLKMLMNSRVVAIEKLGLSVPVEFTFALHYGQTLFQAPGKTGAVISESINYIFHLGSKKAEPGRLSISGDVPDDALPEGLADLFVATGVFEGIPIRHSKRFIYR